jgi:hypothetical protein
VEVIVSNFYPISPLAGEYLTFKGNNVSPILERVATFETHLKRFLQSRLYYQTNQRMELFLRTCLNNLTIFTDLDLETFRSIVWKTSSVNLSTVHPRFVTAHPVNPLHVSTPTRSIYYDLVSAVGWPDIRTGNFLRGLNFLRYFYSLLALFAGYKFLKSQVLVGDWRPSGCKCIHSLFGEDFDCFHHWVLFQRKNWSGNSRSNYI